MNDSIVATELQDGIARVWLNRPQLHNAFDDAVIVRLTAVLRELDADPAVRVLVLAGRGPSFCAGASLDWMKRMANYGEAENLRDAGALAQMLHTLHTFSRPTIARVHGAALAGGTGLVSACDIAVAAEGASFGTTEVRLGLIPATISPYVIAAIGSRAARRYFLTGERFDARQALSLGLVHEVCDLAQLDARVDDLCQALFAGGPQAQRAAKALVGDVSGRRLDPDLIDDTSRRIAAARAGAEAREGLAAFFGKRAPSWRLS
jgi:methylglutaconyl-CoA hydratase